MEYIFPWLTHFVGHQQPNDDDQGYDRLVKILREGRLGQWERQGNCLIAPGAKLIRRTGSLCRDEFIKFRPVCFCDIPEGSLKRHTSVYGRFGLAFEKSFLPAQGANPVFYVAKGSLVGKERPAVPPLTTEDLEVDAEEATRKYFAALGAEPVPVRRGEFFDRLVKDLMQVLSPPWPVGTNADEIDPVREDQYRVLFDLLDHVFAYTKLFDESLPEEHPENFYMEREWRAAGFVSFDLRDVQRLYVAPGFRDAIEREFSGLTVQELGNPGTDGTYSVSTVD